jgi:hypothetical protein
MRLGMLRRRSGRSGHETTEVLRPIVDSERLGHGVPISPDLIDETLRKPGPSGSW